MRGRSIDEDAVINIVKYECEEWGDWGALAATIIERIRQLPPAESEQQWIPCSEKPPEEGHDVLITKEPFKIKGYEQKVIKAKRSVDPRSGKIEWWSPEFGTLTNKAVLAWMPLPEPYRGGENGE